MADLLPLAMPFGHACCSATPMPSMSRTKRTKVTAELVVMKANASPTGTDLDFKWHKELSCSIAFYEPPKIDEIALPDEEHERVFLKFLTIRINTNRPVSASEN